MSELTGYLFDNAGAAIENATVQLLTKNTTTQIAATTTSSTGQWTFSSQPAAAYDVKLTFGSSIRYIKADQEVQATMGEFISSQSNSTYPLRVENATNNASNAVLELRGNNSTRADGDEIYVSFKMDDSGGNVTEFARITAEANDVTDTEEDGELRFGVMVSGTLTDVFTINSSTAGVTDMNLDVSGDLTLDADGGDIFFKDGGTTFGSATNNSGNLIIKSGTTTALTFTGSSVAVAGDLTITGDDLTMGTNTDGFVLIADGTNYNPVAISGDIAITNAGVTSIASGVIVTADLAADAITGAKIADDALDSEHYTDGSIDTAHLAADAITGAKIADDAINSEHYTDGSIDTAHIADNQVTLAKMAGLTRGSLIIGDASGDPSALAKGSANYILTSDGTDIAWAAAPDATNASHVLVTDNESTNENNLITFVEGATDSTGNVGLEMDGNLTYNPSTGTVTATAFAGALTGNVTGNVSGTAATVTSGTQANITTLANLTTTGALNAGSITSGFTSIDVGAGAISTTGAVGTGALTIAGDVEVADSKFIEFASAAGTPTTDNKVQGIVIEFLAAEAITQFDSVYVSTTTGRVGRADANDLAKLPAIGVAIEAQGSAGSSVRVLTHGVFRDDGGFGGNMTVGADLYVGEALGTPTPTIPDADGDFVQVMGVAIGVRSAFINPSLDIIERA